MLNTDCRAHELDNLYVVDTSVFPSIGAVNPALTAMANSLRVGDHLLERMGARHRSSIGSGRNRAMTAGAEAPKSIRSRFGDRPSGEQIEIAHGDQQAVVVEVGGGLRTYSRGRPRAARRLRGGRAYAPRAGGRC